MPNTEIFLSGKCKWPKLITPDTKYDPLGKWSIVLYPDPESLDKIMELKKEVNGTAGIMNHLKKDEDGTYISFTRPTQRTFKGQNKAFLPPEVLDADNKPLRNMRIGNGSDVTLKIEVRTYPTPTGGRGRATRLVAVRVDNLIPFDDDSRTPEEAKQVEGMKEVPARAPF